ncbi:hypothetical protein JP75_08160 [Devosia riboflavina]|uniref:Uncharacterized protein n=1 Tax=Devosia riboflavina TaxID=46914 RepID=A0A087M3P6_9HYPH|nr:hypothetical protein JP75_08160 [Devosia riboflavina]
MQLTYASDQAVLNAQFSAAEMAYGTEAKRQQPHVLMRPSVFPDGDMWCALYGVNIQEGVAGFGSTPELACLAFDANWHEQRASMEHAS